TGTYQWDASYSGDSHNSSLTENNVAAEQVTVSPATPTISTTPNITVVPIGTATNLKDTAVLAGGYYATGTITFKLYAPGCGTAVDTETVTVNGNGTYTTPNGYCLPTNDSSGVYQWDAVYSSGNGNNNGASDNNDTKEQVTVVNPCCDLQNVTFSDTHNGTTTSGITNLRGNTQQGDTVTATFTVPAGDYNQLTLVSYTAPQSSFSYSSAYLQQIYQVSTGVFGPGTHSLTVTLPSSYYQVDFVCGTAIAQLGLNPNDFYSAQGRLNSADNGGTNLPSGMGSPSATGAGQTVSWWTGTTGQALINGLNGGSTSTSLGSWLATVCPNLFGSLQGASNATVASNMTTLANGSPGQKAAAQVLATALAAYATDSSLQAGTTGNPLTVTTYGIGINTYNVGSNGTALELTNNTTYSIVTLLAAIDSMSTSGSVGSSATNAANSIFGTIN
ncbi:MAG TPA: hypothetical protein VKA15_09235, partial [Isosphaeraceae bacterium]|nr:hypothetical protein [Isosphaeraceae bacterium]